MGQNTAARLSDTIKIDTVADADGTFDGTSGTMLDMRDFDGCMMFVVGTTAIATGTNFPTAVKIVSNSAANGDGTDHDVVAAVTTDGGTTETLTAADYGAAVNTAHHDKMILLDMKADQMTAGDRYIGASLTTAGTWPCVIVYVRYNGTFSTKDMFQATRTAFQVAG